MTDFFTHLAGQVLQPSTEVYPALTAQYAPGPDLPAASLVPEAPGLDPIPQTAPAAFVEQPSIDQNRHTISNPLSFTITRDLETNAPAPFFSSLRPQQAATTSEEQSPAKIEPPTLHADLENEGVPAAVPDLQVATLSGFARPSYDPAESPSPEAPHAAPELIAPPAAASRSAARKMPDLNASPPATSLTDSEPVDPVQAVEKSQSVPSISTKSPSPGATHPAPELIDSPAAASQSTAVERPALSTSPIREVASPAVIPMDAPKKLHPLTPVVAAVRTSAKEPEKESTSGGRSGSSLPEIGPGNSPQTGWQAPSVHDANVLSSASTLESVHPTEELGAPPDVPSPFAPTRLSPTPDADPSKLFQATARAYENAARQHPQDAPPTPAQTVYPDTGLQSSLEGAVQGTSGPGKAAGLPHSTASNPKSSLQPSLMTQRAMSGSQPESLPGATAVVVAMTLPIIPLPLMAAADPQRERETGDSNSAWIAPSIDREKAATEPNQHPDPAARRVLQAGQEALVPPDTRNPGKTDGSSPGLQTLYPNNAIRPLLLAAPALDKGNNVSRAEAAGSTVPTLRLTIGRIVVKADLPGAPVASRPVPARRQPAVSLSDYLARHGSHK